MSGIALEILVILLLLLLLLVNGVFSMSEMALVSARKTRLEHRAESGDDGARAALDLAAHPTNFLSAVQVGITLVGAFGGAGISQALAGALRDAPYVGHYAEPIAFGLVVTAITYLSLILGELVPKQIALGNPERVASLVARPMRAIATVGSPLVRLLTGSTNLVSRVLGMRGMRATVDPGVTEQDNPRDGRAGRRGGRGAAGGAAGAARRGALVTVRRVRRRRGARARAGDR